MIFDHLSHEDDDGDDGDVDSWRRKARECAPANATPCCGVRPPSP